jgi:hypothetical protein
MATVTGTWRLGSWRAIGDDGHVSHPMGDTPTGILILTDDGWFSAQGGAGDRRRSATQLQADAIEDDLASWARGYVAYAGRYEVDGDHMHFTGEVSLFPNLIGVRQTRAWKLEGDTLILRPPGQELHWHRAVAEVVDSMGE